MRCGGILLLALALALSARPARAQTREPVGPFVVDVRGLTGTLPITEGWTPVVPAGTVVPSRGFGFDLGAHVYPAQWGAARLGVGAAFTVARGTASAAVPDTPDVVSRSSTFAPQVSFNFGHRLGWSHLSVGYGAAKVSSEAAAVGTAAATTAESGWVGALNFGGGARWFVTDHLGVGFDVRWHRLGATELAPRTTLFHLAVGISVH